MNDQPSLRCIAMLLVVASLMAGCGTDASAPDDQIAPHAEAAIGQLIEAVPLKSPVGRNAAGEPARTLFEELSSDATGVSFVNELKPENNVPYIYMGAGVAVGDYDGDGRIDLYLLSVDGPNRLYRQTGEFKFVDVTDAAGGVDGGAAWSRGAIFFDVDNDADLDLYVCNTEAPNLLYLNQGDGTFVECARKRGLDFVGASVMAGVADYDLDGDLDVYVLTHRPLHYSVQGPLLEQLQIPADTQKSHEDLEFKYGFRTVNGQQVPTHPRELYSNLNHWEIAGQSDVLYRNNGDGTFTDVTEASGIGSDPGLGLSSIWMDFDRDGWLDLYVANDLQSKDRLYRNGQDGTFSEVLQEVIPSSTWFSMGSDYGDINNDGRLDYIVVDMASTTHRRAKVQMGDMDRFRYFMVGETPPQLMRNALFLNTGTTRFMEIAQMAGLAATDWTWAVKLNDLDNDGWIDVFFTNGIARADEMNPDLRSERERIRRAEGWDAVAQHIRSQQHDATSNLAFRNTGQLRFENTSQAWGIDRSGISYGAAQADFDGDGDLDLVVNHHNEPASIYRNTSVAGNRAVVQLRGQRSNRHGVGAMLRLHTGDRIQVRQLFPSRGYMSCDPVVGHFGMGTDARIDRLVVEWPSGHRQVFDDLPVNHRFVVSEPAGDPPSRTVAPATPTQFNRLANELFEHQEFEYDDYEVQPLLPAKLSQFGPGLAWGDADQDGDPDLFVGGAAGQAGELLLNDGQRSFRSTSGPWQVDAACEDLAPLWIDVDSDGDQDLYVTSGSSEYDSDDPRLADRLYLNQGQGTFRKAAADTVPNHAGSSSVAVSADYDGDGDLDLFVGERFISGQYPLTPDSHLLRNDGGRFLDVTEEIAPELAKVGLVTSALWTDVDGDRQIDLLVTCEWGPVHLFRNREGKLQETTEAAGLAQRLGWWNSIAGGDVDNDGDIDYVVMNVGLNTKYGAPTVKKPTLLYYGDMDQTGEMQLVEVKSSDQGLLPVRGLSCSSNAMPFLREKFSTYDSFASSMLTEIYDSKCLEQAHRYEANELSSGVLVNDGSGQFAWRPLPRLAQAAPGFGVTITDFDADGFNDIYAVQNLFTREPETGMWGGGVSLLLRGDGTGDFRPVLPAKSGLTVTGDAKGLAIADFNQDHWPDVAVSQNNASLVLFENRGVTTRTPLAIRLNGPAGNPTGIGSRVVLRDAQKVLQVAEVYAGSGYLSQSDPTIYMSAPQELEQVSIEVQWPDGESTITTQGASGAVDIRRNDR